MPLFPFLAIPLIIGVIWAWTRIFAKMGYSGLFALLWIVPIANLILLIYLATADWPIEGELQRLQENELEPREDYLTLMFRRAESHEHSGELEEAYKQFTLLAQELNGRPGQYLAAHHATRLGAKLGRSS